VVICGIIDFSFSNFGKVDKYIFDFRLYVN